MGQVNVVNMLDSGLGIYLQGAKNETHRATGQPLLRHLNYPC